MRKENGLKVVRENRFEEIFEQTVNDMKELGTYKPEFSRAITRYAEMSVQFEILMKRWYEEGCVICEAYTNKAGATNQRKTPLYQSIESLRAELENSETKFGLNPLGLKRIKEKALEAKKESALARALKQIE